MKYNLGTALRQTWTGNITGAFIFWIWLPIVGFSPVAIMTMQAISLLYQFWIHTELIDKLPAPIEFVFNTPSHHRVHHGSDLDYLDKNHAGVLIIWDRMFDQTSGLSQSGANCFPRMGKHWPRHSTGEIN